MINFTKTTIIRRMYIKKPISLFLPIYMVDKWLSSLAHPSGLLSIPLTLILSNKEPTVPLPPPMLGFYLLREPCKWLKPFSKPDSK
jgi:hypothetical protein